MWFRGSIFIALCMMSLGAQTAQNEAAQPQEQPSGWREADSAKPSDFVVDVGTRIPLSLINSISTKHSAEGDRVYLESVFPIIVKSRIVIPPGSYVAGTITEVKRPGRVKGRGELYLRFDSITLPNGVTRDFRGRVGGLDGSTNQELERGEGRIKSEGNKSGDARNVGEAAGAGTSVGVIAGSAAGRPGLGAGIGAAAGATAGLLGVLLTRGPDVVLTRGTTVEMVLDRPLSFDASDVDFTNAPARKPQSDSPQAPSSNKGTSVPMPRLGRWPL